MTTRTWRDLGLAAAATLVTLAGAVTAPAARTPLDATGALFLVIAGLSLAGLRRYPRPVLAVTASALLVYLILGYPGVGPALPLLFALYATVRMGARVSAAAAIGAILVGGVTGDLVGSGAPPPDVVQRWFLLIGWMVAASVLAEVTRHRAAYLEQVERRAEDAERTREETARRRADEERLRIARELHDSLTHSISIIKVQAGVAVHLARKRDEPIPEALVAIQQASGDAMRELRNTLEVLRTDPPSADEPGSAAAPDGRADGTSNGRANAAPNGRANSAPNGRADGTTGGTTADPGTHPAGLTAGAAAHVLAQAGGPTGAAARTDGATSTAVAGSAAHAAGPANGARVADPDGHGAESLAGSIIADRHGRGFANGFAADRHDREPNGLRRLDHLVEGARRAGVPVTVHLDGEPREVPGEVDGTAYRIVQEALTNVARHAGPATAAVRVEFGDSTLTVRVDDDGHGTSEPVPGVGLTGMRERVTALGGELHVGPRHGGGFTVRAELPIGARA